MSRLLRRAVTVATGRHGRPLAYRSGRLWCHVAEVLDEWIYREPWWERSFLEEDPGCAPERRVFRIRAQDGALAELEHRSANGIWRLYRTFD